MCGSWNVENSRNVQQTSRATIHSRTESQSRLTNQISRSERGDGMRKKWTEEMIRTELLACIRELNLDRMPTSTELKYLGRNDLHCKVARTKNYRGWADHLGLAVKESDTVMGQNNEKIISDMLLQLGHRVERMTTKHPYDLLVNDVLKVDVKACTPTYVRGSRVHTFGLSKKIPTCDLYICLGYNERMDIERLLVIPSHLVRIVTLCIGKQSKYDRFQERWDYIEKYSEFYKGVV